MTEDIRIRQIGGTWVVRAGGAVIAETGNALEVTRGEAKPDIYFPRADIAMAFLDASASSGSAPRRYAIVAKSRTIPDAAWSWEPPKPGFERIADHLAFDSAKATVEQL